MGSATVVVQNLEHRRGNENGMSLDSEIDGMEEAFTFMHMCILQCNLDLFVMPVYGKLQKYQRMLWLMFPNALASL